MCFALTSLHRCSRLLSSLCLVPRSSWSLTLPSALLVLPVEPPVSPSVHSSQSHHSWCFWYFTQLSPISSPFTHIPDELTFVSHNHHFYQYLLNYAPPHHNYTRLRVKARYPEKCEFCSFPIIFYTWVSVWREDHCTSWMFTDLHLSAVRDKAV